MPGVGERKAALAERRDGGLLAGEGAGSIDGRSVAVDSGRRARRSCTSPPTAALGVPVAAGLLYPWPDLLPAPVIAGAGAGKGTVVARPAGISLARAGLVAPPPHRYARRGQRGESVS
ncbi:hypothetical protein SH611_19655 [Geminicoccaceae bacterium 1502E]|nr:hypothetical protein [Geminicoccaceae bacterium 1502E]